MTIHLVLAQKRVDNQLQNIIAGGAGGLNIDGCRIGNELVGWSGNAAGGKNWHDGNCGLTGTGDAKKSVGYFPSNIIFTEPTEYDSFLLI